MRKKTVLFAMFTALLGLVTAAHAQQPKATPELKIQIVFSEFDDGKKVSSLPYTFTAVGDERNGWMASVRLGISVPINKQTKEGESQLQYQDVGTNIDFRGNGFDDGRYKLTFMIERSSVYTPDNGKEPSRDAGLGASLTPLLRRYRGSFDVLLRDGQTALGLVATDPQTGLVLKTEVTLNVTN